MQDPGVEVCLDQDGLLGVDPTLNTAPTSIESQRGWTPRRDERASVRKANDDDAFRSKSAKKMGGYRATPQERRPGRKSRRQPGRKSHRARIGLNRALNVAFEGRCRAHLILHPSGSLDGRQPLTGIEEHMRRGSSEYRVSRCTH